jgi:hypothetical protein
LHLWDFGVARSSHSPLVASVARLTSRASCIIQFPVQFGPNYTMAMENDVLGAVARHIIGKMRESIHLPISWLKPLANDFMQGYMCSDAKHCTKTFCIPDETDIPSPGLNVVQVCKLIEKVIAAVDELQQRNITVDEIQVAISMDDRKVTAKHSFFFADAHVMYSPPEDAPERIIDEFFINGIGKNCGGGVLSMNSPQYLNSMFVGASSLCSNYIFPVDNDLLSDTSSEISIEKAMLDPNNVAAVFVPSLDMVLEKLTHDVKHAKDAAEDGATLSVSFCVTPVMNHNSNVHCFRLCARVGKQKEIFI